MPYLYGSAYAPAYYSAAYAYPSYYGAYAYASPYYSALGDKVARCTDSFPEKRNGKLSRSFPVGPIEVAGRCHEVSQACRGTLLKSEKALGCLWQKGGRCSGNRSGGPVGGAGTLFPNALCSSAYYPAYSYAAPSYYGAYRGAYGYYRGFGNKV